MSFNVERIHKSTGKVLRFLKRKSRRPTPDTIHDLRTSIRTLEANFLTLPCTSKRKSRRLVSELSEIRKHAGRVRDMDVMTADALTANFSGEDEDCLVRLIEYLGAQRNKQTKQLRHTIKHLPKLWRHLKKDSTRLEKLLKRAGQTPADSDVVSATMAKAIQLTSELNRPARLSRKNLHRFRLKVKELRNVLQLSRQRREPEFLKTLGEVKDAIGEWHDWEVLTAIAKQTLGHGKSCRMTEYLRATGNAKYRHALLTAMNLRRNYLKPAGHEDRNHESRLEFLSIPVINATAGVANAVN